MEWPLFVRFANPWATRPQTVNTMANVESVVKPVIWLGRVRPAGVGVLGGMVLFWPTLPPGGRPVFPALSGPPLLRLRPMSLKILKPSVVWMLRIVMFRLGLPACPWLR